MFGFAYNKPEPLSTLSKSGFGVAPLVIYGTGGANLGEVAGDRLGGFIPNAPPSKPPTDNKLVLLLGGTSFCSSRGKLNENWFD